MILRGAGDTTLELTVLGYQYPDVTGGGWDANWLIVRGSVKTAEHEWTFADPCLTTWELQHLVRWMESIGGADAHPTVAFTEPCLAFSYEPAPAASIRVRLSSEAACP